MERMHDLSQETTSTGHSPNVCYNPDGLPTIQPQRCVWEHPSATALRRIRVISLIGFWIYVLCSKHKPLLRSGLFSFSSGGHPFIHRNVSVVAFGTCCLVLQRKTIFQIVAVLVCYSLSSVWNWDGAEATPLDNIQEDMAFLLSNIYVLAFDIWLTSDFLVLFSQMTNHFGMIIYLKSSMRFLNETFPLLTNILVTKAIIKIIICVTYAVKKLKFKNRIVCIVLAKILKVTASRTSPLHQLLSND